MILKGYKIFQYVKKLKIQLHFPKKIRTACITITTAMDSRYNRSDILLLWYFSRGIICSENKFLTISQEIQES